MTLLNILCEIRPSCQPMFILIIVLTVIGGIGAIKEGFGGEDA